MSDVNEFRELYNLPTEWSDENVIALMEAGIEPKRTDRGNWVVDPTRGPIDTLSDSELKDAIDNQLGEIKKEQLPELLKEVRNRLKDTPEIDRWTDTAVKAYWMFNTVPATTKEGLLIEDQLRDRKDAGSYSNKELEAWSNGEIEPGSKTTDAELAVELARRFKLQPKSMGPGDVIAAYKASKEPKVEIQPAAKTTAVETPKQEGLSDMNLSFIEATLNQYLERCAPMKPITMEQGIQAQKSLDVLFRYVINLKDPQGFRSGMDHLRVFISKHRDGLFSDTYAYRFTGGLSDAGNIRESHIQLIELFRVYTNPIKETRKQIHLPSMIKHFAQDRQGIITEYFKSLP